MDMTGVIVLLASTSLILLFYVLVLRENIADLRKSKDELRDSMASYNYYLYDQLRSTKRENEDLRTHIYRQQKEQQKQDN